MTGLITKIRPKNRNFVGIVKMLRYLPPSLLLILGLSACEKKDKPISLPPKGNGSVMQLDMGENYEYQYFVSLQEQKIVHISRMDQWDLAFQTGGNEHGIFLNGGKGMAAMGTGKLSFSQVGPNDTLNAAQRWKVDQACGRIDSAAIGDWKNSDQVFLIRLDKEGKKVRKMKVTYEDPFQYIIEVGDVNSTVPAQITVLKNENQNYTYFSFPLLNTVNGVEPDNKNTWDLQATLYSFTFYDQEPPLPYVVNGFLSNPAEIKVYKDSVNGWDAVSKAFAEALTYSDRLDVIGFDWKKYNIDNNVYTVDTRYTYVVKTRQNAYFKLRFLDFYSPTGVKGSPKFEFVPLP